MNDLNRAPLPVWTESVRAHLSDLPPGNRYLVGVSGGLDSRVLLDLLLGFGFRNLVVCHLNHQLRGEESAADQALVRKTAEEHGLAFHGGIAANWSSRGGSVETAARAARLAFFAEAAGLQGTRELFLAHHADDQVETFIFRLLRGTASLGRAGMRSRTVHQQGAVELIIHRPLLASWRSDLLGYARARRLAWREDATNAQPVAVRNRLRHELIPLAAAIMGRDVKPSVLRCLQIHQAEEDLLESLTPNLWQETELPVDALRQLPTALQRRVLHRWLKRQGIPDVGLIEIESIRSLTGSQQRPAKVNLPGGHHARRRQRKLFLERKGSPGS